MDRSFEDEIQQIGRQMWQQRQLKEGINRSAWIDRLLPQLIADNHLRTQALRFIDAVPMLNDDKTLVRHFKEYFGEVDPGRLPALISWGIRRISLYSIPGFMAPVIRAAVKGVAHRFIGGETVAEIVDSVSRLQQSGIHTSLDLLGEETVSEKEAFAYQQAYLDLIQQLARQGFDDLNLSLKLSSLYSQITPVDTDGAVAILSERLMPICDAAMDAGISLCLDMEQYDYKAIIFRVFKHLAMQPSYRQWQGFGVVLQAYLKESDEDLTELLEWVEQRGMPVSVRLVRGAYWDMETVMARQQGWSVPVWQTKAETDACYERCLKRLFASPLIYPAVATHNIRSLACAVVLADQTQRSPDSYEFQMLYGMSDELEGLVTERGLKLRLYMPYGELLPGIAYLVRRLLENTSDQSILPVLESADVERVLAPPQVGENRRSEFEAEFINHPLHRFTQQSERENFAAALRSVEQNLDKTYPLLLTGHLTIEEAFLESFNPAKPDEIVGRVVRAGEDDAEVALQRAVDAQRDWGRKRFSERADLLQAAASKLIEHQDEFAAWEVKEAGKGWQEANADVAEAIDFLNYYAKTARRFDTVEQPDMPGEINTHEYLPLGVGVILPPWNFPLAIPVGMVAAAIVCGNCVVLKPASETPIVGWHLCKLLQEIGMPEGVVNYLPGSGAVIGEAMVRDPRTNFVAFTGSKEVGLHLLNVVTGLSESQRQIKKVIAEMGGKNAIIIDQDADLDEAVKGVIESAFGYQGQKCSACSRVICVEGIHDLFVARLVDAVESIRIGDPALPGVTMGPVISDAAKQRIVDKLDACELTASCVSKVELPASLRGHYLPPMIFSDVLEDSPLAQQELFAPVVAVLKAKNFAEAIDIANDSDYGLTGGVYSRSPDNLRLAKQKFSVGNLYLNRKITRANVNRQPFGGFRLSGTGFKAGGPDYLLQFLRARNITENSMRKGFSPESV
ncbi:MAG: proline dehydrogenase family protein [Candidatus Thiodiazotropha lotti]|nr:proline dehydrogenase family protein [Candidatus Thiodiazotropha lotti]MCG8001247.1 proline dehydrogenase family protein [Candidatus Thiodiazotropha lotti]MCW4185263.1 proline dehydrogenase family protein [Candidatus Thiodiazotropha weberae]MCW4193021.1 proline dehydrogenase family protein [Candidatus Thiodiazotropha weberae]